MENCFNYQGHISKIKGQGCLKILYSCSTSYGSDNIHFEDVGVSKAGISSEVPGFS